MDSPFDFFALVESLELHLERYLDTEARSTGAGRGAAVERACEQFRKLLSQTAAACRSHTPLWQRLSQTAAARSYEPR